jgi:hypothetical protein
VTLVDDTVSPSVIPTADSTLCGVHGIDSTYMQRAVLYARVSTDAQQKEGTIESQLVELKKQITAAGHVLVKEYIDDGITGTLLDRPALESYDRARRLIFSIGFISTPQIGSHAKRRTRPSSSASCLAAASNSLSAARTINRIPRTK